MAKSTMLVRAPKKIMLDARAMFPSLNDADIIRTMHDSSLFRAEKGMRNLNKKIDRLLKM